jgi:hypothetical protein
MMNNGMSDWINFYAPKTEQDPNKKKMGMYASALNGIPGAGLLDSTILGKAVGGTEGISKIMDKFTIGGILGNKLF